jgi:hypothetical protein
MSSGSKSRCAFKGCRNSPIKNRMFCSEHISLHGVGPVVCYKRSTTFESEKHDANHFAVYEINAKKISKDSSAVYKEEYASRKKVKSSATKREKTSKKRR